MYQLDFRGVSPCQIIRTILRFFAIPIFSQKNSTTLVPEAFLVLRWYLFEGTSTNAYSMAGATTGLECVPEDRSIRNAERRRSDRGKQGSHDR
jgi:hypothetical protein